ncbi:MAG: bifunctional riboflavin kinase/FAD synthetase [Pikeienuella sp.]
MEVILGWRAGAPTAQGATAALGNFDGVHRGHRALVFAARAALPDRPLAVVTFEPHPRRHFQPDLPPFRLTRPAERRRILAGLGVDLLCELTFDAALAQMEPEAFVSEVLVSGLGLASVVVGADFRFGRARRGDAALLTRLGAAAGLKVVVEPMRMPDRAGPAFSSTAIRVALREGRPVEAAAALGRWHTVSGVVERGDQRGRDLGYPTANLAFDAQIVPSYGVYAARVTVHDGLHRGEYDAVASIGERPTFGVNAPNFEVHLFDFSGDLYGAEISVGLVAFLRGEARFDTVDALIAQMDVDSGEARARLAAARAAPPPWAEPDTSGRSERGTTT